MRRIRILFVNERPFNPILGGIERVTDILTKALVENGGYEIFYLCDKFETRDAYVLNYEYPAQMFMLPKFGSYNSPENVKYYESLLLEHNIDIVINQRGLNGGFNKLLSIGEAKKISVLHSNPNSQIYHNIARILLFSDDFKEQIKKHIKICFYPFFYFRAIYKARRMLKNAYRKLISCSDAIVLLSNKDKEVFLSNGVDLGAKILCGIPNPNTFSVAEDLNIKDKEKTILYVGRFDQFQKNVLALIKIWKRLFIEFPDWKLVLVGDGPDRKRVVDYIERNKIRNVYLEGAKRDVSCYYKKASFVCLTSFYEGWGMTLTEGMSYGCIPCTFNNYGAASDIIDDNVNGCLIEAFNIKEYSIRMADIMRDEIKREAMSRAALEKVKEFSSEIVIKKWESLFLQLIN